MEKIVLLSLVILLSIVLLLCLLVWHPAVLIVVAVVGFFLVSLVDYSPIRGRIFKWLSE